VILVQKYGGSSVADVARIQQVARRVVGAAQAGQQVVVVVSAMGNTTNELLALARSVSQSPGRRELDLLVSVGERVSMTLLAMAIEALGVPAASFTGSQSGIITDDNHVAARVIEVRPHRVRAALDEGKVAIVAGFQGVSRGGEVTTLGRGGSDTTAVVLAAALGAEHCEICSDVDGVYSADPRLVEGARRLDELPLDAAVALARGGSKVLLAEAVELARRLGVRLDAASTARPAGSGTRLPPGPAADAVVAITHDAELEHVVIEAGASLAGCAGAARAWWTEADGVHLLVDLRNLHDRARVSGGQSRGRVATVSAVGRRLVEDPDAALAAAEALAGLGVERWWSVGETWTALLPGAQAPTAVARLHALFVESSV
jgi:aspartate kinase